MTHTADAPAPTVTPPDYPALETAALDPYLSYQRSSDADTVYLQGVRLVLGTSSTATDICITPDALDPSKHLRIDADTVVFGTVSAADSTPFTLSLAGKNVTVVARAVVANGGTIDTTGSTGAGFLPGNAPAPHGDQSSITAPPPDGTPGECAQDGGAGGAVAINAGTVIGALNVRADGGVGGRGQDGGDAGNGHQGADGQNGSSYRDTVESEPQRGQNGGPGGRGGLAGVSGAGGAAGAIQVTTFGAAAQISSEAKPGPAGAAAKPGRPGHGAPGGQGGIMMADFGGGNPVPVGQRQFPGATGADGLSGNLNITDLEQVANFLLAIAEDGEAPTVNYLPQMGAMERIWATAALVTERTKKRSTPPTPSITGVPDYQTLFAVVRPTLTQLQLASHQAKLSYLQSDFADAGNILSWISNATTVASDGTGWQPPPLEAAQWKSLNARAGTLLFQLTRGLDYFGNPTNYVPLVAYATYQSTLGQIFTLASDVQQDFDTYTTKAADQNAQRIAVSSRLADILNTTAALKDQLQPLANDESTAAAVVASLAAEQMTKLAVVNQTSATFQQAVANQTPGCSFSDILDCVKTIISIGEAAYGVFKDIKDVASSLTGLGSISGVVSGISTIVSTAKTVAGDVNDAESQIRAIGTGFSSIQSEITTQKPDAGKLVMQESNFDTAMQPYMSMAEAQDYVQAVHDYVGMVQARNQKIVEYDSFATQIARLEAEVADQQAMSASVQSQWSATSDPTAAPIRAFMSALYHDMRANLLTLMYQENQAKNYLLLQDAPFMVTGDTISELAGTQAAMLKSVIDAQNSVSTISGKFQDVSFTFAANDPNAASAFDTFRSTGQFSFVIVPGVDQFAGYSNTRLKTFTVALNGVSTSNEKVLVMLTHSGRAPMVTPENDVITFSHRPVELDYQYDYATNTALAQTKIENELIGLSPLTTWTLSVTEQRDGADINPGLNLSAVDAITVTFSGATGFLAGATPKAADAKLPSSSERSAPALA